MAKVALLNQKGKDKKQKQYQEGRTQWAEVWEKTVSSSPLLSVAHYV